MCKAITTALAAGLLLTLSTCIGDDLAHASVIWHDPEGRFDVSLGERWEEIPETAIRNEFAQRGVEYTAGFYRSGHAYFDTPYILVQVKPLRGMGEDVRKNWDKYVALAAPMVDIFVENNREEGRLKGTKTLTLPGIGQRTAVIDAHVGRSTMVFVSGYCSVDAACRSLLDPAMDKLTLGPRVDDAISDRTAVRGRGQTDDEDGVLYKALVAGIAGGLFSLLNLGQRGRKPKTSGEGAA